MLSEENASSTAFVETQDSTEKLKWWIFVGLFRNWLIKHKNMEQQANNCEMF